MNLKGKRSLSRKNKIFLNESFNENNSTINKINTNTNNREPYNFMEYKLKTTNIENLIYIRTVSDITPDKWPGGFYGGAVQPPLLDAYLTALG